jgi:hypothetical protein
MYEILFFNEYKSFPLLIEENKIQCFVAQFVAGFNFSFIVGWLQVQMRFEVDIKELPEQIDTSTYSKFSELHLIVMPFIFQQFDQLLFLVGEIWSYQAIWVFI